MKTPKQTNWWKIATIVLAIVLAMLLMAEIEKQQTIEIDGIEFTRETLQGIAQAAINEGWTEIVFWDSNTNKSTILEVSQ